MMLPNRELAVVPERKLTRYLLDLHHESGQSKAKFFLSCGFTLESFAVLEAALRESLEHSSVVEIEPTNYGLLHAVEGDLSTPLRGIVRVRSVWLCPYDTMIPSLVSAYPGKRP